MSHELTQLLNEPNLQVLISLGTLPSPPPLPATQPLTLLPLKEFLKTSTAPIHLSSFQVVLLDTSKESPCLKVGEKHFKSLLQTGKEQSQTLSPYRPSSSSPLDTLVREMFAFLANQLSFSHSRYLGLEGKQVKTDPELDTLSQSLDRKTLLEGVSHWEKSQKVHPKNIKN